MRRAFILALGFLPLATPADAQFYPYRSFGRPSPFQRFSPYARGYFARPAFPQTSYQPGYGQAFGRPMAYSHSNYGSPMGFFNGRPQGYQPSTGGSSMQPSKTPKSTFHSGRLPSGGVNGVGAAQGPSQSSASAISPRMGPDAGMAVMRGSGGMPTYPQPSGYRMAGYPQRAYGGPPPGLQPPVYARASASEYPAALSAHGAAPQSGYYQQQKSGSESARSSTRAETPIKLACVADGVYCGMQAGHAGDKCSCKKGGAKIRQGFLKN